MSAEAGPLFRRIQAILEKLLGPDHLDVATVLNNRAVLFAKEVRSFDRILMWLITIKY